MQALRHSPMPSIEVVTMLPSVRNSLGVRPSPTPPGVPVRITSPGLQRGDRGNVADQVNRAEHQVTGIRLLFGGAVHRAGNLQLGCASRFIGRQQERAQRRGCVEGLALQPLGRPALEVAGRDVVRHREPGDGRRGFLRRGPRDPASDHDGELRLPVHRLRSRAAGRWDRWHRSGRPQISRRVWGGAAVPGPSPGCARGS